MSDISTHLTETTTERKPPTLADIVREKTDDGARIIDFFLDVMEGRVDGAELCHRIDAGKQLVKYGSKDAAKFIAKYKGVPCGHSTHRRGDSADPCIADDRTLVTVTLNAPPTLTRDFLTVLSGIDEFLMASLIRAQTVDGGTIIDFLYDVMQDTTEGFRTHHRIAAAKELIVHIVRDEQPSQSPSPAHPTVVPVETGTHPSDPALSSVQGPTDNPTVVPAEAGTQGRGGVARPSKAGAPPEPNSPVVPAEAGTHPRPPQASREPVEGTQPTTNNSKLRTLPTRRTRTQRRRDGAARAAALTKGPERNKDQKPAPAELTIAERRINEKLEQHWHEPDPWAGPIDSTHPGRSPPR